MSQPVLIVDDEEDFAFLLKKAVESTGRFTATICTNPTEAVEYARRLQPKLILLDVMMPQLGGEDVAVELKNHPGLAEIPIIFLTSLLQQHETTKALQVIGGRHMMAKPVKTQALIEAIDLLIK